MIGLYYVTREKCTAYGSINKWRAVDQVWGVTNGYCVSRTVLNDAREARIKRHLTTRGEDSEGGPPFLFSCLHGANNP